MRCCWSRDRPANPSYTTSARRWSPPPVRSVTVAVAPGRARSMRSFTSPVEGMPQKVAGGRGRTLDPENRHQPLLVLGVDLGDDLYVALDARPAELGRQQLVDLEHARGVVHVDLDAHRLLLA